MLQYVRLGYLQTKKSYKTIPPLVLVSKIPNKIPANGILQCILKYIKTKVGEISDSPVVRTPASIASLGSIPGQGTKIYQPGAAQPKIKEKFKKTQVGCTLRIQGLFNKRKIL